jgi:excisionase family DNA binding protein
MLDPRIVEQIAEAVKAKLLPHLQNGGSKITPRLLTVKQASELIGRSESALYKLVARREMFCVRHGRNLRFDVKEIDRWIEGGKS